MSYISVKFNIIIPQNYKDVVSEYNKIKPTSWEPITKIEDTDAAGGFEIDQGGVGLRRKQVSWHKKGLRTNAFANPFSEEEVELLYNAMIKVFGVEKIEFNLMR